jgi:hypothetical protein
VRLDLILLARLTGFLDRSSSVSLSCSVQPYHVSLVAPMFNLPSVLGRWFMHHYQRFIWLSIGRIARNAAHDLRLKLSSSLETSFLISLL